MSQWRDAVAIYGDREGHSKRTLGVGETRKLVLDMFALR